MLELISGIVSLANVVISFISTEELLKYVAEMKDIQEQILAERKKHYPDRDDAKIEGLHDQFKITYTAFEQQVAVLQTTKTGSSSSGTTTSSTTATK